jgi:hypothetical protein
MTSGRALISRKQMLIVDFLELGTPKQRKIEVGRMGCYFSNNSAQASSNF